MINLLSSAKALAADWGLKLTPDTTFADGIDINSLMDIVISWISIIAGILAFVYLVYSGILYLTAAGNAENAKKGQQGIINAIIGIVIIIAAYVIVKAISNTIDIK